MSSPTITVATRGRAGVTLTGVVVASSLLVLAIVPILRALGTAHATTVTIERKTQSLARAQGKLAEIKARSIYHYDTSFSATAQSLGDAYLCNTTDDSASELRTVSVAVGYDRDGSGTLSAEEVEVTLTTYLARRW